ncbi:LLM class flavin-dependent oxidoreductase [Actinocorallia sp. A-T 12471]|uniref:LLM class flavin-dependent oxidoreductase n=1 Tax=Actinocorallia sp. A-T 12471 TaxID=3089813 RepID=UPI0029D07CCF|nr:LLM class flavin-dependent oxidoreductase [Actinocorallia sp. A-T 12471]MDX6740476.1 LLM class flavin-dependent oxidoreductase [Actinocorallia sp. A-T 12471]
MSKLLAVGLTGSHLTAFTADKDATANLDGSGAAFAVAGIERIDGSPPEDLALEPTIAAALLAARAPRLALLAATAPHHDHPYNVARRVASLDHLSQGRSGVLLGLRDAYAPGRDGWGSAGLTPGVPLGTATTRDAAQAVARLWQTWPRESIVADRATGIYARGERIVFADHRGVFDVTGPLTVPSTVQGAPVLAWYADSTEAVTAAEGADLVVLGDADAIAEAVTALDGHTARRPLLFVRIDHDGDVTATLTRAEAAAAHPRVDGILLRPATPFQAALQTLTEVVPALLARGTVRTSAEDTLRARLALPAPEPLLADARPVFAAPEPLR